MKVELVDGKSRMTVKELAKKKFIGADLRKARYALVTLPSYKYGWLGEETMLIVVDYTSIVEAITAWDNGDTVFHYFDTEEELWKWMGGAAG